MANALFVCLHNAGRSQMSEALFERAARGRHRARSAGTTPADRVHPEVVEAMGEVGIDLADRVPHRLTEDDARWADVVVTMGCGDECPYVPGRRYIDWDLPDPAGRPVEEVRATREEIARRVEALVAELDRAAPIACSLNADDLGERLRAITALGAAGLIEADSGPDAHTLRFRDDEETRQELERIVVAESECCPFLSLDLTERQGRLELRIAAPPEGRAVADELVTAFTAHPPARPA
jgi:arsenate reductase